MSTSINKYAGIDLLKHILKYYTNAVIRIRHKCLKMNKTETVIARKVKTNVKIFRWLQRKLVSRYDWPDATPIISDVSLCKSDYARDTDAEKREGKWRHIGKGGGRRLPFITSALLYSTGGTFYYFIKLERDVQ